jgi:transcriptional repressor NrdR
MRFTTFERVEEVPLVLVKRDGSREPFDRAKVVSGIAKACKNLAVDDEAMLRITDEVEEVVRSRGAEASSQDVGREVLGRLKKLDDVAYLRFASVYKGFQGVEEFAREIRELDKASPPKARAGKKRS